MELCVSRVRQHLDAPKSEWNAELVKLIFCPQWNRKRFREWEVKLREIIQKLKSSEFLIWESERAEEICRDFQSNSEREYLNPEFAEFEGFLSANGLLNAGNSWQWEQVLRFMRWGNLNFEAVAVASDDFWEMWGKATHVELVFLLGEKLRKLKVRSQKGSKPVDLAFNAFAVAEYIRNSLEKESALENRREFLLSQVGLSKSDFEKFGVVKIQKLWELNGWGRDIMDELLNVSAQIRMLAGFGASRKGAASAIQSYGKFCNLLGWDHFPITVEKVIRWGAEFTNGGTFEGYLSHLTKACGILGIDCGWRYNRAIQMVRNGIVKTIQDPKRERIPLSWNMLLELLKAPGRESEKLFTLLAWVFILRPESECAGIRRAFQGEEFETLGRNFPDNVVGASVRQDGKRVLALKLAKRKNAAHGLVIQRRCSCDKLHEEEFHLAKEICPTCRLWPIILARCRPGEFLFTGKVGEDTVALMRATAEELAHPKVKAFTLYSIRIGAIQAFKAKGGSNAKLKKAGAWRSSEFKTYLNSVTEECEFSMKILEGVEYEEMELASSLRPTGGDGSSRSVALSRRREGR